MAKTEVQVKSWLLSRTLWFNVITLFLGVIEVVSGVYYIPVEILGLINGIGNLILRFLTHTKVVI